MDPVAPLLGRSVVGTSYRGNHLGQCSCASASTGRTYGRKRSDQSTAKHLARKGTVHIWIQAYAAELEKRIRPHLRMSNGPWRVDETYVKVKGRWTYLYRAVDSRGETIDFLLSAKRDAEAAKRFFRKALTQPHTVNPRAVTVDKNAAYPKAIAEMKADGWLWRQSRLRGVKYLNNIVEQDPLGMEDCS
jgi:transposase-like protein